MRPSPAFRLHLAIVAGLVLLPTPARGQFLGPLENLFRRVDALAISGVVGGLVSADELSTDEFVGEVNALRGLQIEVLLSLAPEEGADGEEGDAEGEGATRGEGDGEETGTPWEVELGLGADYLTGFGADDPTLDLRGSIRGFPTLSAYATPPISWGAVSPYLGVNTGFTTLWNVQAFDAEGRQYDLRGETFQIGASLGLYHASGFLLEVSYRNRNFRSVEWGFPSGVDALPEGWPRAVDLSAVLVSVGYQFGRLGG